MKRVFRFSDLDEWIEEFETEKTVKNSKKIEYYNTPVALDIETTSITIHYNGEIEKRGIMYMWTIARRADILRGRTWAELATALEKLADHCELTEKRRIMIYIQNLAFEFQFMRCRFEWKKVFSLDERVPLYAVTSFGIEFRCSYKLTNYSLQVIGKNLTKWECQKMVGDLDYSLMRHSKTPITETEYGYTDNDVLVITCLIDEKIDEAGGRICDIPLTMTGYTRKYCRKKTIREGKYLNQKYIRMIHNLNLTPEKYLMLKYCFAGGFTHGNAWHVNQTAENIASDDRTSAYPFECCSKQFPMDSGEWIKITSNEIFKHSIKYYCCCFAVEFDDIESTQDSDHPISESKCFEIAGQLVDNGRVVSAKMLKTVITEQDYEVFCHFYKWKKMKIGRFLRFRRGYLPKELIEAILDFYNSKTKLKGVEGQESEYMNGKERLNSIFGMMVTDICRDEIVYDVDEWRTEPPDIEKQIEKYNSSRNRFLFYPWGVWVTAYARKSLFAAIYALGDDYYYADTDSTKYRNRARHKALFERLNDLQYKELIRMCNHYSIPIERIQPTTIKGVPKVLGAWEFEGTYDRFKTLGAKRYLYQQGDDYVMTVAGLNKTTAIEYLKNTFPDPFEVFTDDMTIPEDYSGRRIHTYIDDPVHGELTDYTGIAAHYEEYTGIHLSSAPYSMSMGKQFLDYLQGHTQIIVD